MLLLLLHTNDAIYGTIYNGSYHKNPMHTGFVTTDIGSIGGGAVTDPGSKTI